MDINDLKDLIRIRLADYKCKVKDVDENIIDGDFLFSDKKIDYLLYYSIINYNFYLKNQLTLHEISCKDELLIFQGAIVCALASQALLEKSKEYSIQNDKQIYCSSNISDMLFEQYKFEYEHYLNMFKNYK